MALDKFDRQLRLILLLTSNRKYTIDDLTALLDMSWRTIYRYLKALRSLGFVVTCTNGIYSLDHTSPYFRQISDAVAFTEEEAMTLKRILQGLSHKTPEVVFLLRKLSRIYEADALEIMPEDDLYARNYQVLYQAVKEGRQVMLKGYSSGHSRQTTDRWVEPYMFMSNNSQVRCYELKSGLNKTFNISRIQGVELLPLFWENASLHRTMFTDVFHFSGEERIEIQLRLSRLACNLLREEFIVHPKSLIQEDEDHWLYSDWVCSYVGVGRFVLGLPTEVEILQDEGLKSYIKEQIKHYTLD